MRLNTPVLALAALATAIAPSLVQAQDKPCLTDREVSAIALYSVPSLLQAVKLKCAPQLSSSGYLARRGDALADRYVAMQGRTWPNARSGLFKVLAGNAGPQAQQLSMLSNLPDNAVRPLIDALIVQESSAKIALRNCGRIERVAETMALIDPEVAGTLLGLLVGFVDSDKVPVCPA